MLISPRTPLKANEDLIYNHFRTAGCPKLNFMELISGIIAYSMASWQIKVKLAFLVFDFDENKMISKDEMVILVVSFIKGIGIMTGTLKSIDIDVDQIGRKFCNIVNIDSNKLITLDELKAWAESSPIVMKLLGKHQSERPKLLNNYMPSIKIKSSSKGPTTVPNRRQSISMSFKGRKSQQPVFPSKQKKSQARRSSLNVDLGELQTIFFRTANPLGKATVGNIYQSLSDNQKFAKDSDFLFHEFNFDRNKEITFTDLIGYIKKRRAKGGYCLEREGQKYYPETNTDYHKRNSKTNPKTIKMMFNSFDKNKDGVLSVDELVNGLQNGISVNTIQELFSTYDKDKNHVLDLDEFTDIFRPDHSLIKHKKSIKPGSLNLSTFSN